MIENSNEEELKKEVNKILVIVESKLFLKKIEKKKIEQIVNLSDQSIPSHLRYDVQLILAKKYFLKKNKNKSYQCIEKIKPNFGIETNLLKYFFLKFKLLYEFKKYSDLYKESLEFYYEYEVDENRKKILLFYISYSAYQEKSKKDGDFFIKNFLK